MRSAIATPKLVDHDDTSWQECATTRKVPAQPSLGRRIIREPLLQFLVVGAVLFAGYASFNPKSDRGDGSHRIELTQDDLRQISVAWLAQGRPAPTAEQMRHLVDAWLNRREGRHVRFQPE